MSDPREPSEPTEPESTENTPATPAEPTPAEPTPSAPSPSSPPPFPGGAPAAPPTPSTAPPAPVFAPPTAPLPPASSSLPPIQTPPTPPSAPSAASAPSYGPPSTGAPSSAPSYGAPPVYGTPASSSPSAPTPSYGSPYGSNPSTAGAPPSGQLPYTTPYAPGQLPPRNKGGWMGILSIILGGLALLVCWVPFLDYVTVFGAIGGLVFGLIALFRKFGSRALALTGTIVSGVAFILSVIFIIVYTITFIGVANSVPDYPDYTDDPSMSSPLDPSESDSPDSEPVPGDPTAVPGDATPSAGATVCTDGTAIALGKAGILTYDDENQAEVTINDVELNATDAVLAENSLNETPPDGYEYALISLTVKQLGTDPFPAGGTRGIFKGVAEDIASPADYAVLPQPELLFAPDLTPGASVTGNIAVFVPTSGADAGSLLVDNYMTDNTCELKVG